MKRIMKNLNNYILNEYAKLFFNGLKTDQEKQAHVNTKDFLTNKTLLNKASEELRFCENKAVTASELIRSCLIELQSLGFLNTLEEEADNFLYEIKDQKDRLKEFIIAELKQAGADQREGMNFD